MITVIKESSESSNVDDTINTMLKVLVRDIESYAGPEDDLGLEELKSLINGIESAVVILQNCISKVSRTR